MTETVPTMTATKVTPLASVAAVNSDCVHCYAQHYGPTTAIAVKAVTCGLNVIASAAEIGIGD
jgi:hypothetical protein